MPPYYLFGDSTVIILLQQSLQNLQKTAETKCYINIMPTICEKHMKKLVISFLVAMCSLLSSCNRVILHLVNPDVSSKKTSGAGMNKCDVACRENARYGRHRGSHCMNGVGRVEDR